jgi:hypothetical protein
MKPEIAERLVVLKSVRKIVETEVEFVKDIIILRIRKNSSADLLDSNLARPFQRVIDLVDIEASIEHIFDMGRIEALANLHEEFTKTINSIEYEDKISQ